MGYGDDEPPAIRADAFPATLFSQNHFQILILTFVAWDVIKLSWSIEDDLPGSREIDSGSTSTEFPLPAKSGGTYTFTAQGCARAVDGSTNYCSPTSAPLRVTAAQNTNSLRQLLLRSNVVPGKGVRLRSYLPAGPTSLRTLLGL